MIKTFRSMNKQITQPKEILITVYTIHRQVNLLTATQTKS